MGPYFSVCIFSHFSTYYNEKQARVRRAPVPLRRALYVLQKFSLFFWYNIILSFSFLRYFCSVVYFNNMDFLYFSSSLIVISLFDPWFCLFASTLLLNYSFAYIYCVTSYQCSSNWLRCIPSSYFFHLFSLLVYFYTFCMLLVARSGWSISQKENLFFTRKRKVAFYSFFFF